MWVMPSEMLTHSPCLLSYLLLTIVFFFAMCLYLGYVNVFLYVSQKSQLFFIFRLEQKSW